VHHTLHLPRRAAALLAAAALGGAVALGGAAALGKLGEQTTVIREEAAPTPSPAAFQQQGNRKSIEGRTESNWP
jgi:hypothetical protein